jgi:hypothetical protein
VPRFNIGDRVQLVGDISRFYPCTVGIVTDGGNYPASVLNQYKVRLADGAEGTFFDFQLETPPLITARVIFDSAVTEKPKGQRGPVPDRHVRLLGRDIDIHLKIMGTPLKTVIGQVTAGANPVMNAQVTLLVQNEIAGTTITNDLGEFTLRGVPAGEVGIEIFLPSRRILVPLTV